MFYTLTLRNNKYMVQVLVIYRHVLQLRTIVKVKVNAANSWVCNRIRAKWCTMLLWRGPNKTLKCIFKICSVWSCVTMHANQLRCCENIIPGASGVFTTPQTCICFLLLQKSLSSRGHQYLRQILTVLLIKLSCKMSWGINWDTRGWASYCP